MMKNSNNIGTYLTKHDSLIAATTLLSFRGSIAANEKNHPTAECIKPRTPKGLKNNLSIKK